MTQEKDEQLGADHPDFDADDFDELRNMLYAQVSEFAEEHDLPVGALSPLLLDLDRMRRDIDDLVRDCKRNADEFIEHSKEALQEAQAELDAEAELDDEDHETLGKP